MTQSQLIVFNMALDKLNSALPRLKLVSAANFSHNRDTSGKPEGKYVGWAKESDEADKELQECLRLLTIIKREL